MHKKEFSLRVKPPFRLDLTAWALKRREKNQLDRWDGRCYTRALSIRNVAVKIEVTQKKGDRLTVVAMSKRSFPHLQQEISAIINKMFGLKINLQGFYRRAKQFKELAPLVKKFRGVKPPRFPSLFETLTNAICCQQLSLEAGLTLLNHLAESYGRPFREKGTTLHAFPDPERIKKCSIRQLMKLGFSKHKSEALISLAAAISAFPQLEKMSNEQIVYFLCSLKGIGRWSAEYTLLRGLGRVEILPGDDVGIHKSAQTLLHLKKKPDYEKIKQIEKRWHPFAGIIYFHLLLHKLARKVQA